MYVVDTPLSFFCAFGGLMIVYGNWPLLLIKSNSIRSFFFSKRKENIWSFQGGGHPLLNSHSFDIIDLQ